jgi:thioredoxin-related protein
MARIAIALLMALFCGAGRAQDASPYAIDIPPWFANTFLDFREDVADAARDGKRLMAYFGQDGCPYCRALMKDNFSQRDIVHKMHEHFVAIALNIHGDRETMWLDGETRTEKALARFLDVQFTPTLLFFDEQGKVVARLNGYYPPGRFTAVLDYVASHAEGHETLGSYLSRTVARDPRAGLRDEPFFLGAPHDLARRAGSKPLAVLFETAGCRDCEQLHEEAFRRSEVQRELARFDVARFALGAATPLTTPDGRHTTADAWARDLRIAYTPSIVFFDDGGREVFRVDAYVRPFHLASGLDYVASGAYRSEPSFQRFIEARADRMRAEGVTVDLWR